MRCARALLLLFLGAGSVAGCSSSASSDEQGGQTTDASADVGSVVPVVDGGGAVFDAASDAALDAPVDAAGEASSPVPEAGAAAHQGFASVAGGVRASSSVHVLITSTGQAPGGNASMHSASHTVVGGVVGATQQP